MRYFSPQITIGDSAREKGIYDQVIRIGDDAETAKKVFEYAEEQAGRDKDVESVYKKVEEYIQEL